MNADLINILGAISLVLVLGGCASVPPPPPVTVADVVQMSVAGDPPDKIIARMRAAGMVYRLQASQLTQLHQQGVTDPVLDYMQNTYIAAVRRDQRMEDWDSWWRGPDGFFYGGCCYGGWPYPYMYR